MGKTTSFLSIFDRVAMKDRKQNRRHSTQADGCPRGFTLVELLVVIAIIGILIGMFLPSVRRVRGAALRTTCMNNLRQLSIAALNYEASHMHFPTCLGNEGQSTDSHQLSGMVELLPFCEQNNTYEQITNPSSDPTLESFSPRPAPWTKDFTPYQNNFDMFRCPSSNQESNDFGLMSYAFCIGDRARNIDSPTVSRGVFGGRLPTRSSEITDGSSNTILAGEMAHWSESNRDHKFAVETGTGILDDPSSVLNLIDGSTKNFSPKVKLSEINRGSCWADGRSGVAQFNTILPPKSPVALVGGIGSDGILPASSPHPAIVAVAFADGSTHTIKEDIDCGNTTMPPPTESQIEAKAKSNYGVWGALGTIASGEPMDDAW